MKGSKVMKCEEKETSRICVVKRIRFGGKGRWVFQLMTSKYRKRYNFWDFLGKNGCLSSFGGQIFPTRMLYFQLPPIGQFDWGMLPSVTKLLALRFKRTKKYNHQMMKLWRPINTPLRGWHRYKFGVHFQQICGGHKWHWKFLWERVYKLGQN